MCEMKEKPWPTEAHMNHPQTHNTQSSDIIQHSLSVQYSQSILRLKVAHNSPI